MAVLDPTPYPLPPLGPYRSDRFEAHEQAFNELRERSQALPDGEVVGALLSWPVADGHACYVVTGAEPLTVQHVPFLDAWTVDPILIKGLDADDVRSMLARQRALDALFKRG